MFLLARIYAVDLSANAQKYVKTTKNTKYPNIASVNVRTHKVGNAVQHRAKLRWRKYVLITYKLQTPGKLQLI